MGLGTSQQAVVPPAGTNPGARFELVEGVNHMGFLERADVYDRTPADFTRALATQA